MKKKHMKKFRLKDKIEKKNQNSIKEQAQKIGLKKIRIKSKENKWVTGLKI